MRNLLLGLAATALLGVSASAATAAEPSPQLIFGADRGDEGVSLERVQFLFGGHNYCWYDDGWKGPGFYWCGYADRRGLGWGGAEGFHGWSHNHAPAMKAPDHAMAHDGAAHVTHPPINHDDRRPGV